MDDLEELVLLDQLEVYLRVLQKRLLRGLLTLPEAAMLRTISDWLQFADMMLKRAA